MSRERFASERASDTHDPAERAILTRQIGQVMDGEQPDRRGA